MISNNKSNLINNSNKAVVMKIKDNNYRIQ